ncbi:MAG: hypothetical protein JWM11_7907 [Planctomycetaceae bacterium]|nr:hypothetical protein [Planctomycetaceae bacterium]
MMPETQRAAVHGISRDDLERGIVRINEIAGNLATIQRMMTERHLDVVSIPAPAVLSQSVDALIHMIGELETAVGAQQQQEE